MMYQPELLRGGEGGERRRKEGEGRKKRREGKEREVRRKGSEVKGVGG